MNERELRWLAEAEEVSAPLPEMGVVVFSVADAAEEERQEALEWGFEWEYVRKVFRREEVRAV